MEIELIAAVISGSIGVFAGWTRALGNFIKKLDSTKYYTDFNLDGQCNYAFIVIMNNKDFRNFVHMMGEQFDIIKNYIDGYGSILKTQYGDVGSLPENSCVIMFFLLKK